MENKTQPSNEAKLTAKEQRFVEAYCQCWNGAKAARKAGYSVKSARQIGYENLTKPYILAAIKLHAKTLIMTEEEGAVHLTNWGRGSLEPFMVKAGDNDFALSLSTTKARRNIRLVKKVKQTRFIKYSAESEPLGEEVKLEIELHDAKDAVIRSLELQGKLKTPGEMTLNVVITPEDVRAFKQAFNEQY